VRYIVVTLFYWSTSGWVKYGKFENEYAAKQFMYRHPKKAWKIQNREYEDNIIR
jgi:hypothetical protein